MASTEFVGKRGMPQGEGDAFSKFQMVSRAFYIDTICRMLKVL